jgi:aryl-alcohol dehydrogenase-like predicted oxidoreductase
MHAWNQTTPVEEVMATFDALVRSGKVRYVGFSDVPA